MKFLHYKDKTRVFKAKSAFRRAGVTVVEDFPPEVLSKRRIFNPILQAAFNSNGKYKARLVVDKVIVNGQQYAVSDIDKLPVAVIQNTWPQSTKKTSQPSSLSTPLCRTTTSVPPP